MDGKLRSKAYYTLKELERIPRKDLLHLHLHLDTNLTDDDQSEFWFFSILEAIRYPVYDLIHGNCNMSFTHLNGTKYINIVTQERYLIPSENGPRNGANFFSLTAEEWQQEKAQKPENHDRPMAEDLYFHHFWWRNSLEEPGADRWPEPFDPRPMAIRRWGVQDGFEGFSRPLAIIESSEEGDSEQDD